MANIKSSAKRDEKSKELRAKNRADKTELKTMIKSVDHAAGKGLIHKNNAAHKKSSMSVKLNGME